jgi:hypothetical protein
MQHLRDCGRSVVVQPPDALTVMSVDECKSALGISGSDQDGMIEAAIKAVVGQLEPASGGWLGRALGVQQWELQLSSFHDHRLAWRHKAAYAVVLPVPPLLSIVSVKYLDPDGVDQTLASDTGYRVLGMGGLGKQYIAPPYNLTWPQARCDDASVRIRFACGYDGETNILPEQVSAIVALGVRAMLNNTERNLFISEDAVEGVGSKRYIVGGGAAQVIDSAIRAMAANLAVTEL